MIARAIRCTTPLRRWALPDQIDYPRDAAHISFD